MIDKIISTQEFATLPSVSTKVLHLLEDIDSLDIRTLSKLIETDASLTMKLIKVANSPLFAVSGSINSVQQAIVTLGLNRVTNIALGISIFSKFMYSTHQGLKDLMELYWQHTSSTGAVSKSLSKRLNLNFKDHEFIGGLLHDIGKLAMLQYDFDLYQKVLNAVENDGMTDIEAEKSVFGCNHCEVGEQISLKWKLPSVLQNIIKCHSNFLETPKETHNIVAVVSISNMLCDVWGAGFFEGYKRIEFEETPEWKHLLATSKIELDFEQITFELEKDYHDSAEFMNIMKN